MSLIVAFIRTSPPTLHFLSRLPVISRFLFLSNCLSFFIFRSLCSTLFLSQKKVYAPAKKSVVADRSSWYSTIVLVLTSDRYFDLLSILAETSHSGVASNVWEFGVDSLPPWDDSGRPMHAKSTSGAASYTAQERRQKRM